jgi:hypothetical protein
MATNKKKPKPSKVLRDPVNYRYTALNWDFIKLMAEIAAYSDGKHGNAEQYTGAELTGNRAPLNHIVEHLRQYITEENYDHLDADPARHLAAIAYNAMMEFWYHRERGGKPAPSPVNQHFPYDPDHK